MFIEHVRYLMLRSEWTFQLMMMNANKYNNSQNYEITHRKRILLSR